MTNPIQAEVLKRVAEVFDQHVPFHNLLGLDIKRGRRSGLPRPRHAPR